MTGRIDRYLAEAIVDVASGALRLRQDHDLAGAGRGATHAVGVLAVTIGAADDAQQEPVARRGIRRQIGEEEHALTGRSWARKNTPLLVPPRM
jgi:hypothetical protein